MTKSIIFDLDGTLFDTAPDLINSLNYVTDLEGCSPLAYEQGRNCIGMGARKMIKLGLDIGKVKISEQRLDQLFEIFLEHYQENIANETKPFDGAMESVAKFLDNGWRVAICTNKLEKLANQLLNELDVANHFEVVTGGDTYGVGKPDPKPILETMKKLGSEADMTVMVGDSLADIEGAHNAGIQSIAVDFGYSSEPVDLFKPGRVISDFGQLWQTVSLMNEKFCS